MGFSQPATGTPRVALPYSAMMPLSKKIQPHQRLLSAPLILGEDRGRGFFTGDSAGNPPSNRPDYLCARHHLSYGLSLP